MELFQPSKNFREKTLGNKYINLQGLPTRLVFKETEIMEGELSHVIYAQSSGQIAGHAGLVTSGYFILEADPSLIELRELFVKPRFMGNKIGSLLLQYSCEFVESRSKRLILQPFRAGGLMSDEIRRKKYPLATPQLKQFYLEKGFRELSIEEIEKLSRADEDRYLASQLWLNGISPDNPPTMGDKRSSISNEDIGKLDAIPYADKLRFLKDFLDINYGSSIAIFMNRDAQRKRIEKHLIQK